MRASIRSLGGHPMHCRTTLDQKTETIVADARPETLLIFDNATVVLEMRRGENSTRKQVVGKQIGPFWTAKSSRIGPTRAAGSSGELSVRSRRPRRSLRARTSSKRPGLLHRNIPSNGVTLRRNRSVTVSLLRVTNVFRVINVGRAHQ